MRGGRPGPVCCARPHPHAARPAPVPRPLPAAGATYAGTFLDAGQNNFDFTTSSCERCGSDARVGCLSNGRLNLPKPRLPVEFPDLFGSDYLVKAIWLTTLGRLADSQGDRVELYLNGNKLGESTGPLSGIALSSTCASPSTPPDCGCPCTWHTVVSDSNFDFETNYVAGGGNQLDMTYVTSWPATSTTLDLYCFATVLLEACAVRATCEPGNFFTGDFADDGSAKCQTCPAGKFSAERSSNTECSNCAAGYFASGTGALARCAA